MKKTIVAFVVCLILVTALGTVVAKKGGFTNANPYNSLVRLENIDAAGYIIPNDGIEGIIKYDNYDTSFNAMVNGKGLEPKTEYQLRIDGALIAVVTTNSYGHFHTVVDIQMDPDEYTSTFTVTKNGDLVLKGTETLQFEIVY